MQISKALSTVADVLPRVQLQTLLYPTESMKHMVAMLYARIIKFFHRAMSWYKESRLRHVYTAITRPASLRFKDLVNDIAEYSLKIDQICATSTQAELRIMHQAQTATQSSVNGLYVQLSSQDEALRQALKVTIEGIEERISSACRVTIERVEERISSTSITI